MGVAPPKTEIEDFAETFRQTELLYGRLKEEAVFTLKEELERTEIKIHSIPSRVKEIDSFINKIRLYKIKKPFDKITDIVGLRVICLFLADIERIGDIIRETFEVIKEDNKVDNSKFDSFGYLSVHFIVKLGNNFRGTRYNNIHTIPFEIQVRTIAMDAWANISHYLQYKTDKDIPEELKRDFYALSGMFYVADKHFQLFFEQRKENNEEIAEIIEKGEEDTLDAQPINLDTLKIFLDEKLPLYSTRNEVSAMVEDLIQTGFKSIGEVDKILSKNRRATELFLQDAGEYSSLKSDSISSEGFLSVAIYATNYNYYQIFMKRYGLDEIAALSRWKSINKKYMDIFKGSASQNTHAST